MNGLHVSDIIRLEKIIEFVDYFYILTCKPFINSILHCELEN